MFGKSLQVLIGASLLALAAVVAYAVLNLSSADDALDRAAAFLARREFAAAIGELDLAEGGRSVQSDPALHVRLLRLRQRAQAELGNDAGALRDVEALLRADVADRDALRLDRIRLRAKVLDGPGALLAAEEFLAEHPGHGRALELAGEACQTIYQPLLRELNERLVRDLPSTEQSRARTELWSFVYRPDGDPEIAAARDALAAHYAKDPRQAAQWPAFANDLAALRTRVQEGLRYFQQSLAAPGTPVAAFRAVSLALDRAGRVDDLLVAGEIQRRRGDHVWVDEAGAAAAWALVRDESWQAALATVDRWLPTGTMQKRIDAGGPAAGTLDLLLARTEAAWRTGDKRQLQRVWPDLTVCHTAKVPALTALVLAGGYTKWYERDAAAAEQSLRYALDLLVRAPLVVGRPDLLPGVAALELELLQQRDADEASLQAVQQLWQRARPGTLEPLLAHADILHARRRTAAALKALEEAAALVADDERVFAQRVEVMRAHGRESGNDGDQLLAQCLRKRAPLPDVEDPIGYLLCGEAARAAKQWQIAAACATAAVEALPRARPARLLEIEVALATGRHADAARQVDRLLQLMPPDAPTVELALRCHRAAGQMPPAVLEAALTTAPPSAATRTELLRAALAAPGHDAMAFVTAEARAADAPPELRLLTATALARSGAADDAGERIESVLAGDGPLPGLPGELARAFAAWVRAAAAAHGDNALAPAVERTLVRLQQRSAVDAPPLLAVADELAVGHPNTAAALATMALAHAAPATRSGAAWALAGSLALRTGAVRRCEEAWLAAVAFADGREAAEDLVRLCLATDRPERATQVVTLVEAPTDAALAARCGFLPIASGLLASALLADPADLLTHAGLAVFGQPSMTDWTAVDDAEREERLTILALLGQPALASLAGPRVDALLAASPKSTTNKLLRARVLASGGNGAAAAAIHRELFAAGAANPVFWREVAWAAERPGYTLDEPMRLALVDACASGGIGNSPLTAAFGNRVIEASLRAGGHADLADRMRAAHWERAPRALPLTRDDVAFIARALPPAAAFTALDEALDEALDGALDEALLASPGAARDGARRRTRGAPIATSRGALGDDGPAAVRSAALRALCAAATAMVHDDPSRLGAAHAAMLRHLAADGPHGAIVHFLLAHADAATKAGLPTPGAEALLGEHLAAVAAGTVDANELDATLARLVAHDGATATAARVAALLQRHPAALPLWVARTRLALDTAGARTAVAELRAVVRHTSSPALRLELLLAAAESRATLADDLTTFAALPAPLRQSPRGRYVGALLALREGRPDEALAALPADFERDTGMHLFARGLALLQSRTRDAEAAAAATFRELARDYASSSLARNAGSFASQLSPR